VAKSNVMDDELHANLLYGVSMIMYVAVVRLVRLLSALVCKS
jgi:hypothetical protein